MIPLGSSIAGGEIMIENRSGQLQGIKFWDKKRKVLLACGWIDEEWRNHKEAWPVAEFSMRVDEQIVGVRSVLKVDVMDAKHYNLELVII